MSWTPPWAEFEGKQWDADGNPVSATSDPGLVTNLPLLPLDPGESLPKGVSAHLLLGNWYGNGPEIVLWDGINELNISFPLWARRSITWYLSVLKVAARKKKADPARGKRDGGYTVKGSECGQYRKMQ